MLFPLAATLRARDAARRPLLGWLVALLALAAGVAPASAGPYEDGLAAHQRKDYATAMRLFRGLAEKGDARAQYALGLMYANGEGGMQNFAEAAKWWRLAAEQGDSRAQNSLGMMYYRVGMMYANGQGVAQNYALAAEWIRKAAERGVEHAQKNLGTLHYYGQGVAQSYVQAYLWYSLASSRGNEEAARYLKLTAAKMTPAQLAEAQKLAAEWRPQQ